MRENLRYVIQYHAHTIRILVRIVAQTAKSASFACRFSLNIRQFSLTPAKMEMPMSTTWFVGADWLAEHIDDPEIQIIDARMASPGQEDRNVAQEYLNGHIPGAVFFDIEALSDHTSPLPHMLPRPETFAVAMRELGVNQDKHLIVYDEGNLFSAPRAWWMLRTFGVEKVSILGGGLAGWLRDDLLLEEGAVELPEGEFNAAFNPEAVVKVTDVLLASHENTAQIIDANGWLHTGDLGTLDEEGYVTVRGRSKNLLLTSSGQNIYPEEIESKLNNMPYVSESLIVLQHEKLVALIYPDFDDAFAHGLQQTDIQKVMEQNRIELNQQLPNYSQISKIKIHFEEFEKTAKKSIKRFMYQEAKG